MPSHTGTHTHTHAHAHINTHITRTRTRTPDTHTHRHRRTHTHTHTDRHTHTTIQSQALSAAKQQTGSTPAYQYCIIVQALARSLPGDVQLPAWNAAQLKEGGTSCLTSNIAAIQPTSTAGSTPAHVQSFRYGDVRGLPGDVRLPAWDTAERKRGGNIHIRHQLPSTVCSEAKNLQWEACLHCISVEVMARSRVCRVTYCSRRGMPAVQPA